MLINWQSIWCNIASYSVNKSKIAWKILIANQNFWIINQIDRRWRIGFQRKAIRKRRNRPEAGVNAGISLRLMQFAAVTKEPDIFFAFQITLYGDYPGVRVRVFPQSFLPGKCLQNPFRQTLDFQINTFLFPPDEVQKLLFPAFLCVLPCQHCTSALIGSFDRQMYHHSEWVQFLTVFLDRTQITFDFPLASLHYPVELRKSRRTVEGNHCEHFYRFGNSGCLFTS